MEIFYYFSCLCRVLQVYKIGMITNSIVPFSDNGNEPFTVFSTV